MLPMKHVMYGLVFAIIVYILFPSIGFINTAILFLSSFLIDIDHYLLYVWRKRDLHFRRSYLYFRNMSTALTVNKKLRAPLNIFHTIEFMAVLGILSLVYPFLAFVMLGIFFHLVFDLYDAIRLGIPDVRDFSVIQHLIGRKKLTYL